METFIRKGVYRGSVRAVILDWAGTTVDYGCMGPVGAFLDVFHGEGMEVTVAEAREPMGLKKIDHLRALCRMPTVAARWRSVRGTDPGEADLQRMYARLEPLMAENIRRYSDPIPGVLETVSQWRSRGIRIGSTTGYTRPIMEVLLPEARQKGYSPDAVVTSSDVAQGRPSPFMCYRNAVELEVYPLEAMVKIGDTVSDIHEGLNAGMWTIGLTKTGSGLGLSPSAMGGLGGEELNRRLNALAERFRGEGAHYTAEDLGGCREILEMINGRLAAGERP